jgi:tetratricopeptide (TPR) repeat protein
MAGFIRLGFRDYLGAKNYFDQAIKANPNFGDPHLGLGHYYFRYRDFNQGLSEILTSTLLEPRVSLYQSFLGKAFYQMRVFDKALETYDYAKSLDPKDPTPYLYKGIALTDLNRPGEAIQEFNRSIELNDNRETGPHQQLGPALSSQCFCCLQTACGSRYFGPPPLPAPLTGQPKHLFYGQ